MKEIMISRVTVILFMLLGIFTAQGLSFQFTSPVMASSRNNVPTDGTVVLNVTTEEGLTPQTRNAQSGLADYRAIGQSFQWTGNKNLDAVGIYLSDSTGWAAGETQDYVLSFNTGAGPNLAEPRKTIATYNIEIGNNVVQTGTYVQITGLDLPLTNGSWYGWQLGPTENAVMDNRLFWRAGDTSYAGNSLTISGSTVPYDGQYTSNFGSIKEFSFFLAEPFCGGAAPASWTYVGNEMQEVVDGETGKTTRYLTSGQTVVTHFHYHNGTWGKINGIPYVFFQSSRSRPAVAGETVPGEWQIMAANAKTGDLYYLTTIVNESEDPLWDRYIGNREYYASYNDEMKMIFFFNKQRNKVYAYNCMTGEQKHLLTLPSGAYARELEDFADETSVRLIYPYTVGGDWTTPAYIALADFDRQLNLQTNCIIDECSATQTFNHLSFSPVSKNIFFYNQLENNDSVVSKDFYIRDLLLDTREPVREIPEGNILSHIVWGGSGRMVAWCDGPGEYNAGLGNIYYYSLDSRSADIVPDIEAVHNKLSRDENLWVFDHYSEPVRLGTVPSNWDASIRIYNRKADQIEVYANIIWGDPHPRHAHPVFSTDDSMISFVTGANKTNEFTRIAVMDVQN